MEITFTTTHTRKPKTRKFKSIDSWNMLSWKQAVKLAELSSTYDKTTTLITFFFWLNNIKVLKKDPIIYQIDGAEYCASIVRHKLRKFALSDIDLARIVKQFDWVYGAENSPNSYMSSSSILPKLPINNNRLFPPADALSSLTYEQYTIVDIYYHRFMKSKKDTDLSLMIAALYSVNGKFDPETYAEYIPVFDELTFYDRLVILWFYIGSRKILEKTFCHLFSQSESSEKTKSDPMLAWMKLTAGMLESPADLSVTKKQLVWDVFSYLDEKIRIYNENKTKK